MNQLPSLSADEHDLLQELFNIGVGHAAASLSRLVNQEVTLSVPIIEFRSREGMSRELGGDRPICSVRQEMEGPFSADSMLLFSDENSLRVVRMMLGTQLSNETLAELQQEALSEIGNIVLNACIGAMSNAVGDGFTVGLPSFDVARPNELLRVTAATVDDVVLSIRIQMILAESQVTGYLAFILGDLSLEELHQMLRRMVEKLSDTA